ncbi:MAG: T9SS type A sorting domain-containing protein [Ignavibacteriota bacterium]
MKIFYRFLVIFFISLVGFAPLRAQWERIGWQGGQVYVEAQLGNTLYGTGFFSVFKSTDWGNTWSEFTQGLPINTRIFPGVHAFTVQGDVIYFTSRQNTVSGLIFCKESDTQWTFKPLSLINGEYPSSAPTAIVIISNDSIFAFKENSSGNMDSVHGFFLTTDGGNTWSRKMQGLPSSALRITEASIRNRTFAEVLYFDSSKNKYTYSTYISENFGESWTRNFMPFEDTTEYHITTLTDSIMIAKTAFSTNNNKEFALYRSADLGKTWIELGSPLPKKNELYNVDFLNKSGDRTFLSIEWGFPPGLHTLFSSEDNGLHWRTLRSDSIWYQGVTGKDNWYIITTAITGCFTTDSTFITLSPMISKGAIANERKLVCVSGTNLFALPHSDLFSNELYDSLLVSTDNGSTWQQQSFLKGSRLDHNLWVQDRQNLYASGIKQDSSACIFSSSDLGKSWEIVAPFGKKERITNFYLKGDTIVTGFSTGLLISIDRGKSWIQQAEHPIDYETKLLFRDDILLTATHGNGVYYSTDFGASWVFDNQITFADIREFRPYIFGGRIFLPAEQSGYAKPYHTVFRIATDTISKIWKKSYGLDSNFLSMPSQDEKGILYAPSYSLSTTTGGTLLGHTALYYSLDSGSNWQQWGDYVTNSPDVFIGSDYIFLAGPTELWRGPKPVNTTSVAKAKSISTVSINECYPNPASSKMRISYSIPKRSHVSLSVFDITGKEIDRITGEDQDAGTYEKIWDGHQLPSGSYIVKLSASGETAAKVIEIHK